MAKDFSKYNDDNPVMAILEKAKKEEEAKTDSAAEVQQNNYAASSISEPQEAPKTEEIKKILMNSIQMAQMNLMLSIFQMYINPQILA